MEKPPMVAPADDKPTATPAAPEEPKSQIRQITFEGYSFEVNLDVVDDVENVELIDKIENQQNVKAIVDFLERLLGKDGYEKLKAHMVAKDGRFRLSKLGDIYTAIFEQFDPKG
jgi:hypothetical protein